MNLNRSQFLLAVERGNALLEELRADYPELKLKAVFSRFGPRSGQCDVTTDLRKLVVQFPEMLTEETFNREGAHRTQDIDAVSSPRFLGVDNDFSRKNSQKEQKGGVQKLRSILFDIKQAEKDKEEKKASALRKEARELEQRLLDPDLTLYCGDVLIEFRCGTLIYESLRRLQQDPRLPQELNDVGNIRVVAGTLMELSRFGRDDKKERENDG